MTSSCGDKLEGEGVEEWLDDRDWLPFSVRHKVFEAIADPGSVVGERKQFKGAVEHLANWQARAAIEAMRLAGWTRTAPQPLSQGLSNVIR